MRVLFDHCVPKPFRRELHGHQVRTAFEMGWSDLDNGELLAVAAERFDVVVTVDQNIRHQRNLSRLPLPVIVMRAPDNDPDTLKPFGPFVMAALANLRGNQMLVIREDGRREAVKPR